jgi:hypothetical protein
MTTASSSRTRLAVLGTISDLHREPLAYALACLRSIVTDLAPDLLCAEITREAWENGDLSLVSVEVREALAPVEAATDIVIVPVASTPKQYTDFAPSEQWRRNLVRAFGRLLQWGQRQANQPEAINGLMFGAFCHTVCWLTETMWTAEDRAAWEAQNKEMAENILQAVQRDPGRRVLVAVQCQRLHRLLPLLLTHAEVFEIVNYQVL